MSSQANGEAADLRAVREGAVRAATSGIRHADLLLAFTDALVAHDEAALAPLRPRLIRALGADGLLETASVAANFQRMVRIADATGIPQEAPVMALVGDVIGDLSLREFPSAANTPRESTLTALAGRLIRPIAPRLMSWAAGRARR